MNYRNVCKIGLLICANMLLADLAYANLKRIEGVEAVVGTEVIMATEVDAMEQQYRQQVQRQGKSVPDSQLRAEIIDHLIDQKLMLLVAKRSHLSIKDSEVNDAIRNMAKQRSLSVIDLFTNFEKHGVSASQLKKKIKDEIMLNRVQGQLLAADERPTQSSIESWLQGHRYDALNYQLVDWYISTEAQAPEQAKVIAENWQKKLKKEPKTVPPANHLIEKRPMPLMAMSHLPSSFSVVIKKAPEQTLYGPIKTGNGYHVLQVVSRKGRVLSTDQAYGYLMSQAVRKNLPKALERLRKQIYIEKFSDLEV